MKIHRLQDSGFRGQGLEVWGLKLRTRGAMRTGLWRPGLRKRKLKGEMELTAEGPMARTEA